MTTITDTGLVLIAPNDSPAEYLLALQFRNFQNYIDENPDAMSELAWMAEFSAEGYE